MIKAVNNFISLVKKGFYDGLIFHRVINGFMIQGGCPDGTGMGGPGYSIKGEFTQNRFKNDLKHTAANRRSPAGRFFRSQAKKKTAGKIIRHTVVIRIILLCMR